MNVPIAIQTSVRKRGGLIAPAIVVALLTVLLSMALVLDRLWLDTAGVEMSAAVEAAAFAAAGELAGDHLLLTNSDPVQPAKRDDNALQRARRRARNIAARNRVAGQPLQLGRNGQGGIRFGRRVIDDLTGRFHFVETRMQPDSVRVTARRTRQNGNPVALLLRQISGQTSGNVIRRAEASIDNHVVGVRPFRDVPVPALPLAILEDDPSGRRSDTWNAQIERRGGNDRFAFDRKTGRVIREADGIPEIVLTTMTAQGNAIDGNVQLIDLNSDFRQEVIERQFLRGWLRRDLRDYHDELRLFAESNDGHEFTSFARFTNSVPRQLRNLVGQSRICLLYSAHTPVGRIGFGRVLCRRFAAVRILSVRRSSGDSYRITVQPAIVTTRTAILADWNIPNAERERFANRYIYKLQLTR